MKRFLITLTEEQEKAIKSSSHYVGSIETAIQQIIDSVVSNEEPPNKQGIRDIIVEKRDLDTKAEKLSNFIGLSQEFGQLHPEEQERLREQCEIMWQYSTILEKRIAAVN